MKKILYIALYFYNISVYLSLYSSLIHFRYTLFFILFVCIWFCYYFCDECSENNMLCINKTRSIKEERYIVHILFFYLSHSLVLCCGDTICNRVHITFTTKSYILHHYHLQLTYISHPPHAYVLCTCKQIIMIAYF